MMSSGYLKMAKRAEPSVRECMLANMLLFSAMIPTDASPCNFMHVNAVVLACCSVWQAAAARQSRMLG